MMDDSSSAINANNHPSHMGEAAAAEVDVGDKTSVSDRLTDTMLTILAGLLLIIILPFMILYALAAYFFVGVDALNLNQDSDDKSKRKKSMYQKAQEFQQTAKVEARLISAIWSRLVIVFSIWLVLVLSITVLREKDILGSKLWRWTLFFMALCCGYPLLSLGTDMLLYLVSSYNDGFKARNDGFYYVTGLRRSFNWILLFGSVLIAWLAYFENRIDVGDKSLRKGRWTWVTMLVGAVLWFFKDLFLLMWEADSVYRRFRDRIINVGSQLYFVRQIVESRIDDRPDGDEEDQASRIFTNSFSGTSNLPEFSFRGGQQQINEANGWSSVRLSRTTTPVPVSSMERAEQMKNNKEREVMRRRRKEILLIVKRRKASLEATTFDIKQKVNYFQILYAVSSREGDGISDLRKKINPNNRLQISLTELMEDFKLAEDDAKVLYYDELQAEDLLSIPYKDFERWMLKAHKNCLVLGYTLSDAKGVSSVLNKVLTGLLIAVVIVTWLLLNKLAKTGVLILIVSPFLAATFVFGETCRRIFEGVVFTFISHPFDVGDRCIIDGIELEVKRMNLLTTTFIRIGPTSEETLYPNSVLTTKSITNLKGDPDPQDIVELTIDSNSTTKRALDNLLSRIYRFLKENEGFEHENQSIVVKEMGNSIKLMIHYRHVLDIQDVTHMQCFEKKLKQRSELLLQIKLFLDAENIKLHVSE